MLDQWKDVPEIFLVILKVAFSVSFMINLPKCPSTQDTISFDISACIEEYSSRLKQMSKGWILNLQENQMWQENLAYIPSRLSYQLS